MKDLDLGKLKEYYDFLVEYGGGDLSGEFEDMVNFAKTFNSFKEFIEYEMEQIADDDLDLYDEMVDKFLN
jgi:hypothetical protein